MEDVALDEKCAEVLLFVNMEEYAINVKSTEALLFVSSSNLIAIHVS